jgi:hypothetical protein
MSPRTATALCVIGAVALLAAIRLAQHRPDALSGAVVPGVTIASAVDLDRQAAAFELARLPADPWTFAESLSVAPVSGDVRKRCGADEAPVYADKAPDEDATSPRVLSKPAGPGYVAALQRIDAAMRTSDDPFAQAVALWLNVADALTPAQRVDALVQTATTTGDPRVYALAYRTCESAGEPQGSCRLLDARQWARLDDGNAMPWLYIFDKASADGDVSTQEEALFHIAASSRIEDRPLAAAAVVADLTPDDDANLAASLALAGRARAMSAAQQFQVAALMAACRSKAGGDANRAQLCEATSDLMFGHSDTFRLRALGGRIHLQETDDSSRLDQAHAEMQALAAHWAPATGFSECDQARDLLIQFRRAGKLGEVGAARERTHEALPP